MVIVRRRPICGAIWGLAWLAMASTAASADDAAKQQSNYLSSDAHAAQMRAEVAKLVQAFFKDCGQATDNTSRGYVLQPLAFAPDGKLTAGYWKETHAVEGCGVTRLFNIYWRVNASGEVKALAALNGSTIADPLLQRDTLMHAYMAASRKHMTCRDFLVTDTRYDKDLPVPPQGPTGHNITHVWHETWTISVCGDLLDVPIEFIQADNGTTIAADAKGVTEHKPEPPKREEHAP